MSTEEKRKVGYLVLVDEDHAGDVDRILGGCRWARVVTLGLDETYPTPAGKRLVSEEAWEVLKQGAAMTSTELRESLDSMGTRSLATEYWTRSERWMVAELHRREQNQEDFEE